MITKTFLPGLIVIFTASVANNAWANNYTQSAWNFKTKNNPVERSKVHIATASVKTKNHVYQIKLKCQTSSKSIKNPDLKVIVLGANNKGKGSTFSNEKINNLTGTTIVPTRIRIGNMNARNLNWNVSQKYGNIAKIKLQPLSSFGSNTDHSKSIIVVKRLLKAAKNHKIIALSGFYQDKSFVIHLSNRQNSHSFANFLSGCPVTKRALLASNQRSLINHYLKLYETRFNKLNSVKYPKSKLESKTFKNGKKGKIFAHATVHSNGFANNVRTSTHLSVIKYLGLTEISDAAQKLLNNYDGPSFPNKLDLKKFKIRLILDYKIGNNRLVSFKVNKLNTVGSYWKNAYRAKIYKNNH